MKRESSLDRAARKAAAASGRKFEDVRDWMAKKRELERGGGIFWYGRTMKGFGSLPKWLSVLLIITLAFVGALVGLVRRVIRLIGGTSNKPTNWIDALLVRWAKEWFFLLAVAGLLFNKGFLAVAVLLFAYVAIKFEMQRRQITPVLVLLVIVIAIIAAFAMLKGVAMGPELPPNTPTRTP